MKKLLECAGVYLLLIAAIYLAIWQAAFSFIGEYPKDFYKDEYIKYNVAVDLKMDLNDVMKVTDHMVDYFKHKEDVLSIETTIDGENKDFFNEQDRFHMEEVKHLFDFWKVVAFVCLLAGISITILSQIINKKSFRKVFYISMASFFVLVAVVGVCIAADFNAAFTTFHEIFFDNDLWLFDANTDYMINMLPEGFFFDMVVRIGIHFGVLTAAYGLLAWLLGERK